MQLRVRQLEYENLERLYLNYMHGGLGPEEGEDKRRRASSSKQIPARPAGARMQPRLERSGTLGRGSRITTSPRSGRQNPRPLSSG